MSQITLNTQTPNQPSSLVGSDAKNALPISITAMDMVGLTWIFKNDEDILVEYK